VHNASQWPNLKHLGKLVSVSVCVSWITQKSYERISMTFDPWMGWTTPEEELVRFWRRSDSRSGSRVEWYFWKVGQSRRNTY